MMMNIDAFMFELPLVLLLVVIGASYSWVVLRTPLHYFVKLLLVPLLIFGSFFSYSFFGTLLGQAYPEKPVGKNIYVAHLVLSNVDGKQKFIEVFLLGEKHSRLYRVPYSAKLEAKLDQAEKGKRTGLVVELEGFEGLDGKDAVEGGDDTRHGESDGVRLRFLKPSEINPKQ